MKNSHRFFTANKNRHTALWLICALSLFLSVLVSLCVGSVNLSLAQLVHALTDASGTAGKILRHVRIPRTLASMLAGAALAAAGAIIQNVLNNPLAGPNIIGVNAGAGFGAVLFMVLFPALPRLIPAGAFAGSLAAVLLVYGLAKKSGASKITLVLAGVAVNAIVNAGIDTITTLYPDVLVNSNAFKIGGVSGASLSALSPSWIIILAGILLSYLFHNELDVLTLGEESAKSLGLPVGAARFFFLTTAAALAGAAVSIAGLLGFIGIIVPHAVRFFTGNESKKLLPACTILGASFLTLCDVLARSLFKPYEIPVGILLAFIGGPFFIYLLTRRKVHD